MFPEYEKREDIPEAFRDAYHEVDGKWVAKQEAPKGTPTQEDLDKVKGALDKEREARKKVEKDLKAAKQEEGRKKAGITDEQLKELRADVRSDLVEEFQEKLDAKDKEIGDLKKVHAENRELKLDARIKATMMSKDVGVKPDRIDPLFLLLQDQFDLTEDGKPKLVNHPGKTVAQYLKDDAKKLYPEFYIGTKAGGGGAGGAFNEDGTPVSGTTADDVMANPKAAMAAARAAA